MSNQDITIDENTPDSVIIKNIIRLKEENKAMHKIVEEFRRVQMKETIHGKKQSFEFKKNIFRTGAEFLGYGLITGWLITLLVMTVDEVKLLRTEGLTKEEGTAQIKLMGAQYVENHSDAVFNTNKKLVKDRVREWKIMEDGREQIFGKKVLDGSQ